MELKNVSKTYGLTHIAVAVKDVERTLKFYQSVFDMKVMYHKKDFIQLTTPGCNDILVFKEKKHDEIGHSAGIAHFGFRLRNSQDIFEMEEKIIRAGGVIREKGEFVPGSPYIFFNDPDGYEVEIWYELIPAE